MGAAAEDVRFADGGNGDMAEEGFLHATGGGGGFEVLGGGWGTFDATGSEDEIFD